MALERLRVIIDVQAHNAKKMLTDFSSSIRSADGFAGKFKAGWSSAAESIKANAASIALVAGGALIAFGAKALAAFTSASKAAIDFGKATNQTTEAASRWIAVADDYQISTASLQTAMGKVGRSGKDFIDVLETINNTAPAERAKVAFELLGKSWQSVAPLLGKTREEYEQMLATVEEGQVITDKEAAKAERMRLAQDRLEEALGRVTMAVGEFVAEMAPMIEGVAKGAEVVTDLNERFGDYIAIAKDFTNPFDALDMDEDLLALEGGVIKSTVAVDAFGDAADNARPNVEDLLDAFSEAHGAASAVDDLSDSFGILLGQLDTRDAIDNVLDAFDDLDAAWSEAAEAQASGSEDADRKTREAASSVRDLQRDVIAYGETVDGVPPERITEILALINQGSVDEARALFESLTAGETKTITVFTKFEGDLGGNAPAPQIKIKGKGAKGGTTPSSGAYLVGENGPEIVDLPGGSNVTPNHALGGGGATNVTVNVNVGPGADPVSVGRATADALAAYYRNGGTRP